MIVAMFFCHVRRERKRKRERERDSGEARDAAKRIV